MIRRKLLLAATALMVLAPAGGAFAHDNDEANRHERDHREHRREHRSIASAHESAHEEGAILLT